MTDKEKKKQASPLFPGMAKEAPTAKAIKWLEKDLYGLKQSHKKQVEKIQQINVEIMELEDLWEELKNG